MKLPFEMAYFQGLADIPDMDFMEKCIWATQNGFHLPKVSG